VTRPRFWALPRRSWRRDGLRAAFAELGGFRGHQTRRLQPRGFPLDVGDFQIRSAACFTDKIGEDLIGYCAGDGESSRPLAAARRVDEPVIRVPVSMSLNRAGVAEPVAYGSPTCRTDRRDITHLRPCCRKTAIKQP
jgi:hypothetical protein